MGRLWMMYRLVSILGILLMGYRIKTTEICPGEPFYFKPPFSIKSKHFNLFFRRGYAVERKVANTIESLDPQYPFSLDGPFIPEVMKKHEGEYYWQMINVRSKVDHIRLVLKDCSSHVQLKYGEKFGLKLPADASLLEFIHKDSGESFVLWSRINAANEKGSRGTVSYGRWEARRITQADQGRYAFLRESGGQISSTRVTIEGELENAHVTDGHIKDNWQVQVNVPIHEVQVIYISPGGGGVMLFQDGVETDEGFTMFGDRIKLKPRSASTGFSITRVQPSDAGQYEIHDKKGHLAMTMRLERDPEFDPRSLIEPLGISAGVIAGLLCCCWCCCKCCSDSDKDETPATSPDEDPPVYVHDTVVLSGSGSPLQPSSSMRELAPSSGDMSTPHPWQSSPPPYAAVSPDKVPDEGGGTGGGRGGGGDSDGVAPSAPTPPPAYPAQQYQPVAWSSGLGDFLSYSPLSMDTGSATAAADSSTYTSDNLNF